MAFLALFTLGLALASPPSLAVGSGGEGFRSVGGSDSGWPIGLTDPPLWDGPWGGRASVGGLSGVQWRKVQHPEGFFT